MNWKRGLSRGLIGLDVGERWIKAVQLSGDPKPQLLAAATLPRDAAPPGDPQPLHPLSDDEVRRLKAVLVRRGFGHGAIIAAAPGACVFTSVLDLPPRSSGAPLEQIARTELAHVHRREPATMEVAFWELPKPARGGEGMPAMAVGCSHEDALRLIEPLERRRLNVAVLDTQGWALARACESITRQDGGMVAAVNLGWLAATLVLLHQDTVVYERQLGPLGLRSLSESLRKGYSYSPEVIEFILRDVGFTDGGGAREARAVAKARGNLESHFDALKQELRLAVSYAHHQYPQAAVTRIVLTGGGAGIPGLDTHIASALDAPVQRLTPGEIVDCPPTLAREADDASLTIAVGLAMFDGKGIASCLAA